ncbi:MAG: hypothetical protein QOH48_401 [Actinomycetota bacterium]|nr:hypothetical protein [Actinomycetota bacterium]
MDAGEVPLNDDDRLNTSPFPVALGWFVAATFFIATLMTLLLSHDITAPAPPPLPRANPNLLTGTVVFFANERQRWVQEVVSNCLFAAGFVALVGVAILLSRRHGSSDPGGSLMVSLLTIAAALGVGSVLLKLGGEHAALDPHICDCKYSATQIISQGRALTLIGGSSDWLLYGFLGLAAAAFAIATFSAIATDMGGRWKLISGVIAILFAIGLVASALGASDINDLIVGIGGGILIPIWAVWTGTAIRGLAAMDQVQLPL